jgi:hypothetical protein
MMNFPSCSCACAVDIATASASTANRSSWYMVLSAHVPGLIDLFRRYSCIFQDPGCSDISPALTRRTQASTSCEAESPMS